MPKSRGRKTSKRSKQQHRSPVERQLFAATRSDDSEDAIERRMFTMPYVDARIRGENFDGLDPESPDERGILIEGEHPEYHEALADPDFDGLIDGVKPGLHLAMHEIIANQLWDNDPPEVWQTARKLRDRGVDRHDILHAIGEVMMTHLHASLVDHEPFDLEQYRTELAQLGRDDSIS